MLRALQTSLYLFVLVLSINKTSAQYQFDLWNTDNGLPHNTIRAILQTRDGYLWLASLDGLVKRHDGVFTTFTNDQGLPGNDVRRIWADDQGSIVLLIGQRLFRWKKE